MPTEGAAAASGSGDVASRRILRLALGTTLCFAFSQAAAWQLAYLAPILAMTMLATPLQPPGLLEAVKLTVAAIAPLLIGSVVLLPFFEHLHPVGILLLALALFHVFHFSARGAPGLLGIFLTIAITLNVSVGSISVDMLYGLIVGLAADVICAIVFVWIAFAFLPDVGAMPAAAPAAAAKPDPRLARWKALRATIIVLPVSIFLLLSPASATYTIVMVKVATMGQQASTGDSRKMARSLMASTFWGGLGAVIGWSALRLWPSLFLFTLLVALAALYYGRGVFRGSTMHPHAPVWSYALLTFLVVLLPSTLDTAGGSAAAAAFWTRLVLVGIASIYGSLAWMAFDALTGGVQEQRSAA